MVENTKPCAMAEDYHAAHIAERDRAQVAEERVERLREALDWALAEIEGRTRYDPRCIYTAAEQFENCIAKAHAALNAIEKLMELKETKE